VGVCVCMCVYTVLSIISSNQFPLSTTVGAVRQRVLICEALSWQGQMTGLFTPEESTLPGYAKLK